MSNPDFKRVRIVLSLVGNDSIVKKTAAEDDEEFIKWRKNVIEADIKRNGKGNKKRLLHVAKKSRSILKKLPVFGLTINGTGTAQTTIKALTHNGVNKDINNGHKVNGGHNGITAVSSNGSGSTADMSPSVTGSSDTGGLLTMDVRFGTTSIPMDMNMNMNINSNLSTDIGVSQATMTVNNSKDKAFMDKIDLLIQNLETDPKKNKEDREPVCNICGQEFKNFQALGGHKKAHNPEWKKSVQERMRKKKKKDYEIGDDDDDNDDHEDEDQDDDMDEDAVVADTVDKRKRSKTNDDISSEGSIEEDETERIR